MNLFWYDMEFQFANDTDLVIADALSHDDIDTDLRDENDVERSRICEVSPFAEFPDTRTKEHKKATKNDSVMQKLVNFIYQWMAKK